MPDLESCAYADKRLLRFACINGIARDDLPIALEIWSNDLAASSWSTREMLKLAHQFALYFGTPDPKFLSFGALEGSCGLDRDMVNECLRGFRMFGAVVDYTVEAFSFRAQLNLTYVQRLKVLELRARFAELTSASFEDRMPWHPPGLSPLLPELGDAAELAARSQTEPRVRKALDELAQRLASERLQVS